MKVLVVYESMFGNTRKVAEAIATALREDHEVAVSRAGTAPTTFPEVDLVIVGAPTHAHGLPRPSSRRGVPTYVTRSRGALHAEPEAEGPGVREWLAHLSNGSAFAAAFDTRLRLPALFVGKPSKVMARRLRRRGLTVLEKQSFFVDGQNHLLAGEESRARSWADEVASDAARAYARSSVSH
jgi:hypothetical protein